MVEIDNVRASHGFARSISGGAVFLASLVAYAIAPSVQAEDQPAPAATYTVGVLTDNYPFSYRDERDGVVKGYVVDLLAEIEKEKQLTLERRYGTTSEINPAFENGDLDMLQSFVPNDARRSFAEFSNPYLSKEMTGAIFVRRSDPRIASLADLRGLRVMVHQNSLGEKVLRDAGLAESIVIVGSVEEGFRSLSAGANDATLASRLTGLMTAAHLGLANITAVPGDVNGYSVSYCFAVRKGRAALLGKLNDGLGIVQTTARGPEIYEQWFGPVLVDESPFDVRELALAVSGGLGVALLVALWAMLHQRRLRHRIARQADSLRASEESYRAVFEATMDGLVVLERRPGPEPRWEVVQHNRAVPQILGQPAVTTASFAFLDAFPLEGTLWFRIVTALGSTEPRPFEHDRSRDGKLAWVQVSVIGLGDDRRLLVLRDITESRVSAENRRKSEAQLRQNQKLEAIGTLASGIAHDFNNILTAIIGNAELMRLDLDPNHVATSALKEIADASNRARFLVRQILTFSRRTESRREPTVVTALVKEALRFVSATMPSTIEFRHTAHDGSPAIEVDPTQLHQVIMNLCTNAAHAMAGRSGTIEIEESALTLTAGAGDHPTDLKQGDYLLITVRDTGTGMPPEVLQRLFEPFFTTKPAGEGTGLGLAVVHGIVRDCGGAIAVNSTPGKGTTFRLYFPATAQPSKSPAGIAPLDVPRGHGEAVLLVDDEPAIILATGQLLKRLGYSVAAFSKPMEALDEFRRRSGEFSVVITDLTMPRMSGIELTASLRAITPDIPVILVSGFINDRELALARAARITQIVDKPLTVDSIATAIARCLRSRTGARRHSPARPAN